MAPSTTVTGVLLAAGAGRRAGGPKALRRDPAGRPWVVLAVRALRLGGCARVVVVTGCRAREVGRLLQGETVTTVCSPNWRSGMRASLRSGLIEARRTAPTAVLVHLVDLPDVTAEVVRRVLFAGQIGTDTLRRASYRGRPGHPVLLGAAHLPYVLDPQDADRGARAYLLRESVHLVPCEDLAGGDDVDEPGGGAPPLVRGGAP